MRFVNTTGFAYEAKRPCIRSKLMYRASLGEWNLQLLGFRSGFSILGGITADIIGPLIIYRGRYLAIEHITL